jgi:autotransporter-associated beta strand protein
LNAGVLQITNSSALGTSSLVASTGGELHLSGNITVNNLVAFSGAGFSTNGSLQNLSGNNTLGNYTVASATGTRIGVASGSTLNITNNITVSGGGTAGFRFLGGGTLVLEGNNTSVWGATSGVTSAVGFGGVGGLTIKLGSDTALGASTINFDANSTIQSKDATARILTNGMTFTSSATSVTLGAASTGNMSLSGNVTIASAVGLSIANTQTALSGVISGSTGSLTKNGNGTLLLSGGAANTFNGTTTVSAGVLSLGKTAGVTAITGNLVVQNGGKVAFAANNQIADTATVTMSGNGSIFNGTGVNTGVFAPTETIGAVTVTGGGFQTGGGSVWNVTGAASFTGGAAADTYFASYSGSSFTANSLALTAMTGTAGSVLGAAGFYVYGNSNSTQTTVTVGSGGLSLNGSTLNLKKGTGAAALGSALRLDGDVSTSGSTASTIREDTSGPTTTGTVSLALSATNASPVTRTFNVAGGGADLTVAVAITNGNSSAASLAKTGNGNLTFSVANTYTGTTTVTGGTLQASAANALGTTSGIMVNTGGTLLVSANGAVGSNATITMNSTATGNGTAAALKFSSSYNGTVGALTLDTNSIFDLGSDPLGVQVHFSSISGLNTCTLSIYNWTGTTLWEGGTGNNTDQIYAGNTLSQTELEHISFYSSLDASSFRGTGYQIMTGSFINELGPVPEPSTWVAMVALIITGGTMAMHRRSRQATEIL